MPACQCALILAMQKLLRFVTKRLWAKIHPVIYLKHIRMSVLTLLRTTSESHRASRIAAAATELGSPSVLGKLWKPSLLTSPALRDRRTGFIIWTLRAILSLSWLSYASRRSQWTLAAAASWWKFRINVSGISLQHGSVWMASLIAASLPL